MQQFRVATVSSISGVHRDSRSVRRCRIYSNVSGCKRFQFLTSKRGRLSIRCRTTASPLRRSPSAAGSPNGSPGLRSPQSKASMRSLTRSTPRMPINPMIEFKVWAQNAPPPTALRNLSAKPWSAASAQPSPDRNNTSNAENGFNNTTTCRSQMRR